MGLFASIFGGNGGNAQRAAGVAAAGQTNAANLINQQYQTTAANYQPYMAAGTGALGSYQNIASGISGQLNPILGEMNTTVGSMQPIIDKLTSNNLNAYQQSPGYQFRMQQGINALQNSAAANGTLFSGATGKALTQYGQDYGTNEYQTYLANLQNQLDAVNTQLGAQGNVLGNTINSVNTELTPYQNLMTQGAGMASNLGQLGQNASQARAGYVAGAANDTANGMIASSNALNNTSGQLLGLGGAAVGGMFGGAAGAQLGSQLGGMVSGSPVPLSMVPTASSATPTYTGAGYQPQPYQQPGYSSAPPEQQPAYIQPQAMPTTAYNGTNYANPTQAAYNGWRF